MIFIIKQIGGKGMTEKEYTSDIIIPLLINMGFMEVTYNHGIVEFGKDIIFSEYDRFGNKKYHAAQIKVGDISGGNESSITDLISHISNAFNYEFPDLITKTDVSISDFFLIVSGKFIGNAKEMLLHNKLFQNIKHRIHFYQGHHIEELQKKSYKDINELIQAQINEFNRNIRMSNAIKVIIQTGYSILGRYIDNNLQLLINKLCTFEDKNELRYQLEGYQLIILKNNHILSYMPITNPIMGNEFERKEINKDADIIIERSNQLIVLLKNEIKYSY